MPKITEEPLEAIQAKLFQSDLNYLRGLFKGNIGVNKALRQIVRSYVLQTKAQAAAQVDNYAQEFQLNPSDFPSAFVP
jgi:hypothetical protein